MLKLILQYILPLPLAPRGVPPRPPPNLELACKEFSLLSLINVPCENTFNLFLKASNVN